ncbi:MAG: thiamine-phosphate kinase [Minwuia sp.]|uniref:thiamine-phosphate kinase n=1 Tax=Minwuia sp. TaxID=2493630 RepID=UPI003A84976B
MTAFGEFEFIAELLAPLAAEGGLGLTDDAAILPKLRHGEAWTVTNDMMVEGVHYLADDLPDLIARKLIRVNVSDLAAMGARPVGYTLALSSDGKRNRDWFARFCSGLAEDQAAFGIGLFGGDTTSTPGPFTLSLTAFGAAPRGEALRRNGARPGDAVWVSGTLGDAALGLRVLQGALAVPEDVAEILARRYRLPEPRPELGQSLRGLATSCLDVSDGLAADLGHVAKHSRVGIEIDADRVPVSDAARAAMKHDAALAPLPLTGGDDYELAFTLPDGMEPPEAGRVHCTRIGRVIEGDAVSVLRNGQPVTLESAGWRHF